MRGHYFKIQEILDLALIIIISPVFIIIYESSLKDAKLRYACSLPRRQIGLGESLERLSPRHCGWLSVRPVKHTCLEMEKEDGSHPCIMDRAEPVMRPDPVSLFYGNNVPPPGGFVPSADRAEISAKGSPSFGPPWLSKKRIERNLISIIIYLSFNSLNQLFKWYLFVAQKRSHFLSDLKMLLILILNIASARIFDVKTLVRQSLWITKRNLGHTVHLQT